MNKLLAIAVVLVLICVDSELLADDWITAPSYFTHDPATGNRTSQYSPIGPFYTYSQPSFRRSGFRNTRSSIQVGTSTDNYHTTEQWGDPAPPYGEWRHPYRPNSVPYNAWGPQFYGMNQFWRGRGGGFYGGWYPGNGIGGPGFPGGGNPGVPGGGVQPDYNGVQLPYGPRPNPLQPGYSGQQQLLDGRYPPFQQLGPFDRRQIFDHFYPPRQDDQQPGGGN